MVDTINKDEIIFSCPFCNVQTHMDLGHARYYLRSRDIIKCEVCTEKFKPWALDIFRELALNPHQEVMHIETGESTSQMSIQKLMMEAFKSHNMTKNDLRNMIRCDDNAKFEKAWAKLLAENYVILKGMALNNREIYGIP